MASNLLVVAGNAQAACFGKGPSPEDETSSLDTP